MQKRIEWTPPARADVQRIDRQTALGLLEGLADYVLTGYGDVERLTDVSASTITAGGCKSSVCYIEGTPTGEGFECISPRFPRSPSQTAGPAVLLDGNSAAGANVFDAFFDGGFGFRGDLVGCR